jgi:hypothetical protein
MIEYGVRDPNVMVGGQIGGKPLTYVTDVRRTIASSGIWFPFHPVVTSAAEWRPLRGWDRTHEYDAAFELVETIYGGHSARVPGVDDRLENGVYSFQYHPELGGDPSVNDGKGTLDYVRYAINLAERRNFWIASQRDLYQRMGDYEDVVFAMRDGGRTVTVTNPTARTIDGLVIEQRLPFASVRAGDEEIVHVVRDRLVTVPSLTPGNSITLRFDPAESDAPLIRKPSHKGLIVLDARHRAGETRVRLRVCRAQRLAVEGVDASGVYRVEIDGEPPREMIPRVVKTIQALLSKKREGPGSASRRTVVPGVTTFLDVELSGPDNRFAERTIRITELPRSEADSARARIQSAIPPRSGRVI